MANKVVTFLTEVVDELKKVSWTTRKELIDSTVIVIVSLLILATYIGVVDWALAGIIRKIVSL
ncbi:MAG: preprotein translocase subunit SecE [Candidatus Ancaeobacter aquaticus]|nr:preprotein translocase subunit SecE [Candidatus Ancaeobacter aquaticus]